MRQTTNYRLNKPTESDKPLITGFDNNWDIIDTQMKANADEANGTQAVANQAAANFPYLVNLVTDTRYNADPTGALEAVTALQNAVNDAQASGAKAIHIYTPPGTYKWEKSGVKGVIWNGSNTGSLRIHGAGKSTKILRGGTSTTCFIIAAGLPAGGTYANFSIDNMLFDWNNKSGVQWGYTGVIFSAVVSGGNDCSFDNIWVTNVETRNVYRPTGSGGPWHQSFCIDVATISTPCSVTNIHIEDFTFGQVGGGGHYGVLIQKLNPVLAQGTTLEMVFNGTAWWDPNWTCDNIFVKRGFHQPGVRFSYFQPQSNIIVGGNGHGGKVVIEDFVGLNSGDDGIEINSMQDVTIQRCFIASCTNAGIYTPNHGGMLDPENQIIRVIDCLARSYGPQGAGLGAANAFFLQSGNTGPLGHIYVKNCQIGVQASGNFKSFTVEDCHWWSNSTYPSGFNSPAPLNVSQYGGKATLNVRNCSYNVTGVAPNNTWTPQVLNIFAATDLFVEIDGIGYSVRGSGGANIRPSVLNFLNAQRPTVQEPFTNGYTLFWAHDAGLSTDVAPTSGNVLTSVANSTSEHRMAVLANPTEYDYGPLGPSTDRSDSCQFTPGATVAGYKGGVTSRVDASNYLDAYITDDGTNSYLCLDKLTPNVTFTDAVTNGTTTVTSASAAFTNADAGYPITITASFSVTNGVTDTDTSLTSATANFSTSDVGLTVTGTGIQSGTTIASVTNSTTVVLSKPTTATATGVTITLASRPMLPSGTTIASVTSATSIVVSSAALGSSTSGSLIFPNRRTSMLGSVVGGVGTVTALASPTTYQSDRGIQLAARVVAATTYSLRLKTQANVVTADYWTSVIHPSPSSVGSANTASATLSAIGDISRFGTAGQSYGGISWVPMGTDATIDNFWVDRVYVLGGNIKGVKLLDAGPMQYFQGVLFNGSSSTVRFHGGKLSFRDCDFSRGSLVSSGTIDFGLGSATPITDTLLARGFDRRGMRLAGSIGATTSSVTVPASGTAYVPTNAWPMQIAWSGGTLTAPYVETSSDGGVTWTQQWFGNQAGAINILPYDQIRWTYSSVPTVTKRELAEQPTQPIAYVGNVTTPTVTLTPPRVVTSSTTMTNSDDVLKVTTASVTITLQSAASVTSKVFRIKNSSAGNISWATTSSQTVDGSTTGTIASGVDLEVFSDGSNWVIL